MKRFPVRTVAASLLSASLLGLTACLNTETEDEHEEEHALYVVVRDSLGAAATADTVHWSYAGDPVVTAKAAHSPLTDSVQRGAIRVGTTGSVWKITDHVHGSLYLRASRNIPHPTDAGCNLTGYTVAKFSADTLSDTVSLTMNVRRTCPQIAQ
jgi:hypothetical protein